MILPKLDPASVVPGVRCVWCATVSNYGHTNYVPAIVVRVGPKRVTISIPPGFKRTQKRNLSVKVESLREWTLEFDVAYKRERPDRIDGDAT